ncbi:hypothetical protein PC9H_010737 [Pleurotus ostreatus]|uniref:Uncharacterized protein n=2 Tax=Pleurotus TaxID=5320 RepID=A0A8H6ZN09_PLEOS|nr:uncharacterized protein PC9H_010737 [Pleurotus ostreatus]KAF7422581.1 hypothetical protein PC9H_010737 [Pleurotus ostreatus]KAG9227558.1 hypothetical protein CCMSSC00406_0000796 [Pleurotus cornucopiae]KAJ8691550.1 hypothetical protein PTI98_011112 [Pleurotus ostreatus]
MSTIQLPDSLNLPSHLSAHKYFFVCTLTVAAWDTLVLSPRTWRLFRSEGWPLLKIIFHFLRIFMPVEFTVVGVAFFDTQWTQDRCQKFYLFEPICTAILLAAASLVHVTRIYAIYDKSRTVLYGMGSLLAAQIVVTAVCCGFYMSVPLKPGQGCIAGPKHNWVGIYWLLPTLLYTVSFVLAIKRSIDSLSGPQGKPLTPWKLMLRDGLNLYGSVWGVNMVTTLFWFIMKPTGPEDPIKTIITSMAAVLTTSMTLRIILNIRGPLSNGGTFTPTSSSAANTSSTASTARGGAIRSNNFNPTNHTLSLHQLSVAGNPTHTYTLDVRNPKPETEWNDSDVKEVKSGLDSGELNTRPTPSDQDLAEGVKITIDKQVGYDTPYGRK